MVYPLFSHPQSVVVLLLRSPASTPRCRTTSQILADRISAYVQAYTCYGSVRPFGISTLLGGVDRQSQPKLYCVEPSGVYYGYRACAIGKGKALAKTELEKIIGKEVDGVQKELTVREAVLEVARM